MATLLNNETIGYQKSHVDHLLISSSAFTNNGRIPKKYTCDGKNVNPPLQIDGLPDDTKSMIIIVDDPDAPINVWSHWVVWNILPTKKIPEGIVPGVEGMNDFWQHKYGGPCPPSGVHRYFFRVYALDCNLALGADTGRHDLEVAIKHHVLAYGHLIGLYSRQNAVIL